MLLLSAALVLGMQTEPPAEISVASTPNGCETRIGDRVVPARDLSIVGRTWATERRAVKIVIRPKTSSRCVGGTMFALQQAGVADPILVGSENVVFPPPPSGPPMPTVQTK